MSERRGRKRKFHHAFEVDHWDDTDTDSDVQLDNILTGNDLNYVKRRCCRRQEDPDLEPDLETDVEPDPEPQVYEEGQGPEPELREEGPNLEHELHEPQQDGQDNRDEDENDDDDENFDDAQENVHLDGVEEEDNSDDAQQELIPDMLEDDMEIDNINDLAFNMGEFHDDDDVFSCPC